MGFDKVMSREVTLECQCHGLKLELGSGRPTLLFNIIFARIPIYKIKNYRLFFI